MCGISGFFGNSDLTLAKRMLGAIAHRGPDDFRVNSFGAHSLGAARLEIEGGAAACQPLIDEQAGIAVVFNGEIYNYQQLRHELESAGFRHDQGGEIEVIKNLYLCYGNDFPHKLTGMFAIAIFDERRNSLLLARDPIGIKPLYYTVQGRTLAFASEIKGLLQIDTVTPVFDMEALEGLMTFGYVFQQERTLFRGIKQISPGTTVLFDGKTVSAKQYYSAPPAQYATQKEGPLNFDETAINVRKLLAEAVQSHLSHGSTQKAFYLSGGIDSSFITTMAATELSHPVVAYTLADDESSDDLQYARKVARALGIEHREVPVDLNSYLHALPDYIHHYEHVVAGGIFDIHGGLAFHILSGEIAKEFKVAFSGEGADELFGGYYWTYTHPCGFSDRIRKRKASVGANGSVAAAVNDLFPQPEDAEVYRKNLLDWLMKGGLSNYHLCSVDRSCGAFGFEIRPVYLDTNLADAAQRLPIEYKLGEDGRRTKVILKEAARPLFAKLGIESVLTREKLGMPWAVRNLESSIQGWADGQISNKYLAGHPYRRFLTGKLEACMFDLFYYIFMVNRGVLDEGFSIQDFFSSSHHEHLYS